MLPHLASFLGRLGAIYRPKTAIDPCCEDVAAISACDYVPNRRALFRNAATMKHAQQIAPNVQIELRDITRIALDKQFDLVVAVVPFGAVEKVDGKRYKLDVMIAKRCLDIVAQNGVCLLIVPPSFATSLSLSDFRNRVLEDYALDAVIELPPRSLWEQTAIGGSLLIIRRGPTRSIGTYIASYDVSRIEELVAGVRDGVGEFFVSIENLRVRWDRYFHDPSHSATEEFINRFETKRLDEIGEIYQGIHPRKKSNAGEYLVITPRHLRDEGVVSTDSDRFLSDDNSKLFARSIVKVGDVVVSQITPSCAYVYQASDPAAVAGPNVAIIRAKYNKYISTYLNTDDGKKLFQAQTERYAVKRGGFFHLSVSALSEIRIPLLPVDDLNALSDKSIKDASIDELVVLREKVLLLSKRLEATEAQLEQERSFDLHRRFVERQLILILEQQHVMDTKLDHIVYMLSTMREDIESIKRSSRDEEEKLARMYSKLDLWMEAAAAQKQTMEEYTTVVKKWLGYWDQLDPLTRKFLPSAEHLYDELEKVEADDFSPFVVQYCRSLENEILLKLFCAYHDDLKHRQIDINLLIEWDLRQEKPGKIKSSAKFAKNVKKDERRYTLGEMNFIMQLIKPEGNTLAASRLIQDFRGFVLRYFEAEVAKEEFLDRIETINRELRNKAAHPSLVSKDLAEKCILLVRATLCELLQSWHENPPPNASSGKDG